MLIKVNSKEQLNICLEIIHRSFKTIAEEFNLTKDNCPNHTAFMPIDKLIRQFESGQIYFCISITANMLDTFHWSITAKVLK